jgi:hypothetical protein
MCLLFEPFGEGEGVKDVRREMSDVRYKRRIKINE